MKKLITLTIILSMIGCANKPESKNKDSVGKMINAFEDSSEPYSMLPQAALFYPNGALLDIRIGTMPYYWYSIQKKGTTFTRPPTTMMLFETKKKYTAKDEENRSLIQRISFGENELIQKSGSEALETKIDENIKKFVTAVEEMRKVELILKKDESNPESLGQGGSTQSNKTPNDLSEINVPYVVFSFDEKEDDLISLNAPLEIIKFNKDKKQATKRYFAALYPSVYSLRPSNDLKEYMFAQARNSNNIKYNKDADCSGFVRYYDDKDYYEENGRIYYTNIKTGKKEGVGNNDYNVIGGKLYYKSEKVSNKIGNCPYAKYWLVNYLITAKAIVYLDSKEAISLNSGSLKINDNSLSSIGTWIEKSFKDGKEGSVRIESNVGKSTSLNTVYAGKKVEIDELAWSCIDSGNKCLPSGGIKGKDGTNEIPIYAIYNLDSEQYATMIEKAPYQNLAIPMK